MLLKSLKLLTVALFAALIVSPACATTLPEVAVGPVISTTGLGFEAATPLLAQRLNLNIGATLFGFNDTVTVNGMPFYGKARLGAVPIFLSYYPFGGWFNLQAGIYLNDNNVSLMARAPVDGTIRIFHQTFTAAQLGIVTGSTHYAPVAPYVGIGFGQPFRGSRLSFTGSLGVMFQGSSNLRLQASNPAVLLIPGVPAAIAKDENTINHDARIAQYFPVVNVGIVYRF
jgi:hypothetical protein